MPFQSTSQTRTALAATMANQQFNQLASLRSVAGQFSRHCRSDPEKPTDRLLQAVYPSLLSNYLNSKI